MNHNKLWCLLDYIVVCINTFRYPIPFQLCQGVGAGFKPAPTKLLACSETRNQSERYSDNRSKTNFSHAQHYSTL